MEHLERKLELEGERMNRRDFLKKCVVVGACGPAFGGLARQTYGGFTLSKAKGSQRGKPALAKILSYRYHSANGSEIA